MWRPNRHLWSWDWIPGDVICVGVIRRDNAEDHSWDCGFGQRFQFRCIVMCFGGAGGDRLEQRSATLWYAEIGQSVPQMLVFKRQNDLRLVAGKAAIRGGDEYRNQGVSPICR